MKISLAALRDWQADAATSDWFIQRFPAGEAHYQEVLDAMADNDLAAAAHWLMDKAGPADCTALQVFNDFAGKHLFAAGPLLIRGGICVHGWVRAGLAIDAERGISAGLGIVAGRGIRAGGSIFSGGEIRARAVISAGGDIRAGNDISADAAASSALAASGSSDLSEAATSEDTDLGLIAGGEIVAAGAILSASRIAAGDAITAGSSIECGQQIHAGGSIHAAQSICARQGIVAGGCIRSGADIQFGGPLEAGDDIDATDCIRSCLTYLSSSRIKASGAVRSGYDLLCDGDISAARLSAGTDLRASRDIRTAGDILAGKNITTAGHLRSDNGSIHADACISAGKSIRAGLDIRCRQTINAGPDYGIFAATTLPISQWPTDGRVLARDKPVNLISGHWLADDQRPETMASAEHQRGWKQPTTSPTMAIKMFGIGNSGWTVIDHLARQEIRDLGLVKLHEEMAAPKGEDERGDIIDLESRRQAHNARQQYVSAALANTRLVFVIASPETISGKSSAFALARQAEASGLTAVALLLLSGEPIAAESAIARWREHFACVITLPGGPEACNCKMASELTQAAVCGIVAMQGPALVTPDLEDICEALSQSGMAGLGIGDACGSDRACEAVKRAIASLHFNRIELECATHLLAIVTASDELQLNEVRQAIASVLGLTNVSTRIIFGAVRDARMGESFRVTLIASGFPWWRPY